VTLAIFGGAFVYAVLAGVVYRVTLKFYPRDGWDETIGQKVLAIFWPVTILLIAPALAAAGTLKKKRK